MWERKVAALVVLHTRDWGREGLLTHVQPSFFPGNLELAEGKRKRLTD
jgi:hypothetical protein